ncbi:hypothetical protein BH10BAC2_BH10BAC2_42050 [soil metagenome]
MKTQNTLTAVTKNSILDVFSVINKKGGPDISDYSILNKCIDSIPYLLSYGSITTSDIEMIKEQCEFLKADKSVMGHIRLKPLGYAGDYQIIERIYQKQVSEKYFKWDQYSMANPAAEAVRNRKEFFKTLIHTKLQQRESIELLNIASGPARDLKEIYDDIDPQRLKTTCIEIDERAIEYAKKTCMNYLESIKFINQNIFKFQTDRKFDIIWSAGLFDYFNDKTFIQLLKQLMGNLKETGEICIGNFSKNNPGQVYMEVFGEWFLNHRSEEELIELAVLAGAKLNEIRIDQEPLRVNLFLRVKK